MRSLTLFIPGLFGPDTAIHEDDLPALPNLNWFLSRADRQALHIKSPSYQLCEMFGLKKQPEDDYPIAAISRLSDDNQPPEGFWLRADPVHIAADRDGLILLDATRFRLSQHDALALADEVNRMLEPHGLSLEVPVPYRWYIKLQEPQQLRTTPVDVIVGKDVLPFMPSGDDRVAWIQLLNEIQMTLHSAEINLQREQEKKLPINSLWFWGVGELPELIDRHWSLVMSDDLLAKGLAMVAATPFHELPACFPGLKNIENGFNGLIAFQSMQRFNYYHDLEGWFEALLNLEQNWFTPLRKELSKKHFDKLVLRTDSMVFTLTPNARYRFWKKKQNLLSIKRTVIN